MRAWSWPVRLLLPVALVAGLVIDDQRDRPSDDQAETVEVRSGVEVPAADALSSTWLCPTVQLRRVGESGVDASAQLVITNTVDRRSRARIELLSATSAPRVEEVELPGLSSTRVPIDVGDTDELVAALVESPSGGVVVTREFTSPFGHDAAPCASRPADRWFVATGDTQRDATEELVLFNPLPSDAVVDMSFATEAETGAFVAVDLEGLVVPPQTAIRVDIGEHVRRRDLVAATIDVRAGRIVVDQFQTFDGSSGRRGFSAQLGTTGTAQRWLFASGLVDADRRMEVVVMNPSDEVAEVDLASSSIDAGGDPVAITIGPREAAKIEVLPFLDTLPTEPTLEVVAGAEFGLVVESANGIPVVVGVQLGSGPRGAPSDVEEDPAAVAPEEAAEEGADDAADSMAAGGLAGLAAISAPTDRWLIVVPAAEEGSARLAIQAPSLDPRTVEVQVLGGTARTTHELSGSGTIVLDVEPGTTLLLIADGPVATSLIQHRTAGPGLSGVVAVGF